ncbi:MAG TPA: hypothetical protein PLA11_08490 [Flavobacteriales bacterium]|nr:hypothetical protein [Flavobacteriales bacterium]HPF67598.1 hypothetical protein [Flavobacteriales bacterium]
MLPLGKARPFELWREQDRLHLHLASGTRVGVREMKELLRLIEALDPGRMCPVLYWQDELVQVDVRARDLLRRACRGQGRAVGFVVRDVADRVQGNFFQRFHRPRFPFRLCHDQEDALRWFRERRQAIQLGMPR